MRPALEADCSFEVATSDELPPVDGDRMALYLYRIEPTRSGMPDAPTDEEQRLVGEHFAYLSLAYESGVVRWVGRTLTAPHVGLALFEAADEVAASAFVARDPAVIAGVFSGHAQPFREVLPMRAG
jgi:uncharacterized protein YciI